MSEKKDAKKVIKKNSSSKKVVKKSSKTVSNKDIKNSFDISLEEADSVYHVSLLAQTVCVIGVLAISVLAIFENSFTVPIEVLVGVTLFIMAFNNYNLFKRKGMTIVYIVFGILSFIVGIAGYFK